MLRGKVRNKIAHCSKYSSVQRVRLSRHKRATDWERRVSTTDEHCQQLIVNSRHDLKRGIEVDCFADLQRVKLPCRSEQQCCSIFPSIGSSTVEVVTVQLGVPAASYYRVMSALCSLYLTTKVRLIPRRSGVFRSCIFRSLYLVPHYRVLHFHRPRTCFYVRVPRITLGYPTINLNPR